MSFLAHPVVFLFLFSLASIRLAYWHRDGSIKCQAVNIFMEQYLCKIFSWDLHKMQTSIAFLSSNSAINNLFFTCFYIHGVS